MSQISKNNKRIAKNTVLLYMRTLITILISLYTSRVILQTLGVEDYGIYGIVGGVVIMLTFLNSSMSGATSRFITFALGERNKCKLQNVFNTAFYIHVLIAILVFIVAESIGLWFVCQKLVIPEDRIFAAQCVYHLFTISTIITIMQTPFNATIIAYERMDAFAYIEILNSILKLLIVFLLPYLPFDKLITYGCLFLGVNFVVFVCYVGYSFVQFDICRIRKLEDRSNVKPMLKYCLWDLFGSLSGTLKQQGTNIIINMFFGVLLNAASSIATQVQAAVSGLASNVIQAFRPQIIKSYSQDNIPLMQNYVCNAIKYTLLLYGICIIPLIIELDLVLTIWLGIVPEHTLWFCRLLLLNSYVGLSVMILITTNHATGKIKYLSTATGIYNMLILPVTYVAYKYFFLPAETTYVINICFTLLTLVTDLIITKRLIPTIFIRKIVKSIVLPVVISSVVFIPCMILKTSISNPYIQFILIVFMSIIAHLIITYRYILSDEMKQTVRMKLINKIK